MPCDGMGGVLEVGKNTELAAIKVQPSNLSGSFYVTWQLEWIRSVVEKYSMSVHTKSYLKAINFN